MATIIRRLMIALLLITMIPTTADAQGGIVVGVEPEMYDTVVAGVQGWNAAGVGFVVQPSGCGTGDVTFCYSGDPWSAGGDESWTAWYLPGTSTIWVSTVTPYPFTPSTVCHELGHWLGLHYHRDTTSSCMYAVSAEAPPSPDDADLAALGLSWVAAPAPAATEPEPETASVAQLPKTGTGPREGGEDMDIAQILVEILVRALIDALNASH